MLINWKFICIHSLDVKCLEGASTFSAEDFQKIPNGLIILSKHSFDNYPFKRGKKGVRVIE